MGTSATSPARATSSTGSNDWSPDLSVELLRDDSYPFPTPSCEALIETGLSRIGLPRHA